ncbi:restriction endonuclease fold toxin-2 domain-containing protein [Streptomyces sp. NPDC090073]|uniref:restriction endonuclease fold toxin-2 domain-containing protein n=1 Tax=Streptomyces sp. NPDC090073 TaxID=3365936 RepID=UPI00380AC3A9
MLDEHLRVCIPHALDSSQSRVKMPQPDNGGFLPNLPPFLGPLIRVPTLVPAAYRPLPPSTPHIQPVPPVTPPDPRFPQLTRTQGQNFQIWLDSLRKGDISGGKPAEQAYQRRVSGFPEFEVPIPTGFSPSNTLMVDGFRSLDGMAVEAKYVNKPNQRCYRSLEDLRKNHATGDRDFLYATRRCAVSRRSPTNNQDTVQYWRIMMAAYGVKGHARYGP